MAKQEAENSEDPLFIDNLNRAAQELHAGTRILIILYEDLRNLLRHIIFSPDCLWWEKSGLGKARISRV